MSIFDLTPGSDEFREALDRFKGNGIIPADPAEAAWLSAYEADDSKYKELADDYERHEDRTLYLDSMPPAYGGLPLGPKVTVGSDELVYDLVDKAWFSDNYELSYDESGGCWTLLDVCRGRTYQTTIAGETGEGRGRVEFLDGFVVEGDLAHVYEDVQVQMLSEPGYDCLNGGISEGRLENAARDRTTLDFRWSWAHQSVCSGQDDPAHVTVYYQGELQVSADGLLWGEADGYYLPPEPEYPTDLVTAQYNETRFRATGLDGGGVCYQWRVRYSGAAPGQGYLPSVVYSNEITACTTPAGTTFIVPDGGLVGGGRALVAPPVTFSQTTSGGVRGSGSALQQFINHVGGGVRCGGQYAGRHTERMSGGAKLAGSAYVPFRYKHVATGGLRVHSPSFPGGYTHRLVVTIDKDMVADDLDEFTTDIVALVAPGLTVTGARATTPGGVALPCEFISYESASGKLAVAVRTDLSDSIDTVVWVYFGD